MATLIVVYSAITWAGMGNLGRETWLRHGEAFAVAFSLPARFAVSRGRAGPCQVRPPAVRVFEGRGQAQRSQTPMLILMVGYTIQPVGTLATHRRLTAQFSCNRRLPSAGNRQHIAARSRFSAPNPIGSAICAPKSE